MSKNFELMQRATTSRLEVRSEIVKPATILVARQAPLRPAVEAFFRQWKLFAATVFAILLATVLYALLSHKQYMSEMKFLVQNARENVVVTPERTNATNNVVSDVTEEQVNSELELLHSHDVIDQVADPGWSSMPSEARTPSAARNHEKLLGSLQKRLTTEIVRKTNIIDVSILANSPDQARDDLERLAAAYLAEHRRLQRPEGASEFFASEAERARQSWNQATERLASFQHDHQVLSVPDHETLLDREISDSQNELFTTDSQLHEIDAELADASHRLHDIPAREVTQKTESPTEGAVQQLETLVVDLQNRRTALATNYNANDRMVRELDEQIATATAALNDAKKVIPQQQTTDVDPAWQQVHTTYVQNEITRQAVSERRGQLDTHIKDLKSQLADLQNAGVQFNNLQSQADELKDNYQLYMQKRDQAQIEDAMDAHKLLNVAVAEEPTSSYIPARPKKKLDVLLGGMTALFVGFCAIYFAETGRNTIATPRELDAVSRYPVLATVPRVGELNGSGSFRTIPSVTGLNARA